MHQLLIIIHVVLAILAIGDVMTRLQGTVPRVLWLVCILALPILGSGFWYYVQYVAPRQRRLSREKRNPPVTRGEDQHRRR